MIAYEMALQLVERGHEVGLLAIIDQRRPGWRLTARNALPVICTRSSPNCQAVFGLNWSMLPPPSGLRTYAANTAEMVKSGSWLSDPGRDHVRPQPQHQKNRLNCSRRGLRALRAYRPKPLRAPITLFRADVQLLSHLALDSTLGWSEVAQSEMQVRVVPGSHGSIATEPLVRHLAKIIV